MSGYELIELAGLDESSRYSRFDRRQIFPRDGQERLRPVEHSGALSSLADYHSESDHLGADSGA